MLVVFPCDTSEEGVEMVGETESGVVEGTGGTVEGSGSARFSNSSERPDKDW